MADVLNDKEVTIDKASEKELSKIQVVGDLADYAREFLLQVDPAPEEGEEDAILITVDGDKELTNGKYLEINEDVANGDGKAVVYLQTSEVTQEQVALVTYLKARGIAYSFNLEEAVRLVRNKQHAN